MHHAVGRLLRSDESSALCARRWPDGSLAPLRACMRRRRGRCVAVGLQSHGRDYIFVEKSNGAVKLGENPVYCVLLLLLPLATRERAAPTGF